MKKYWFGDVDERLKKDGKVMCPKCGKYAVIVDRTWGVLPCDKCRSKFEGFGKNGWSNEEKIKSRSMLPDGTIIAGREGMALRDRRLKMQQEYDRYRKITGREK